MPKARLKPGTAKCLKFEAKQQVNSKELLELVKTIKGIKVEESQGTISVTFPPEMLPTRAKTVKHYTAYIKKRRSFSSFSKGSRNLEAPHHYSAIMLK